MTSLTPQPNTYLNRQVLAVLNFLMVSVMLASFAAIIGQTGRLLFPEWGIYWYPLLTFLLSFLTLLMRYALAATPRTQQNRFLVAIVEIVVILLAAKVISMVKTGPMGIGGIWHEILSWPVNPLENFFNLDTLLRFFGLLLMWMLTWMFSGPLNQLEEDEVLMEQEKSGFTFTDRYDARRKLISVVFTLGMVMIVLLGAFRSSVPIGTERPIPTGVFVVILLVYFFTGFLFFALNQYAIMKARWYFSNIQVNPDLAKRWLYFSLSFILIVIAVIIFLPTRFAFGISSIAEWLVESVFLVMSFFFSLIITPFVLVVSLFESLFNGEPMEEPLQRVTPEAPYMPPQTFTGVSMWDVLRTFIFWLVFFGAILITIRYYINNNPRLKSLFTEIKIFQWLRDFFKWLFKGFREFFKATRETIDKGVDRIQTLFSERTLKLPGISDLARRLPHRQAIILIYTDWIKWNSQHGYARNQSQTPSEYARGFSQHIAEPEGMQEQVFVLTSIFTQARYARRAITKEQVQTAQTLSSLLKKHVLILRDLQATEP